LLLTLAACGGKFTQTTEADVGFFADNTIAMLRDANLGFSKGKALYTKEIYDPEWPESKGFDKNKDQAEFVLKIMVTYSLKLVQIADAEKTQAGRVKAYADYLAAIPDERELAALQISREDYENLAKEIRKQTKLIDALKIAQPLVDAMGRYMNTVLDDFSNNLDDFSNNMDNLVFRTEDQIDQRYQLVIRYQEGLEREKYAILAAFGELYQAAKGDTAAYRRLIASDAIIKKSIIPGNRPTEENLEKIGQYLLDRLDGLHRIQQEIEPDWKLYRATQRELDELHDLYNGEIRKIRLINIIWVRAHQKMASGKVKPAEWFDVNDAPGTPFKLGTGLL